MLFSFDTALQKVGAHSSTQIPSVVIDFPSAAEFSDLWGGVTPPHAPPLFTCLMERYGEV